MSVAPAEIKACCASAYASRAARFLLGDSFHPGGAALTSRLIAALEVGPGDTVVDVGCGPGASSEQLARETGCSTVGVDLAVPERHPHPLERFVQGDAEALPLEDESMDGALCECAFCTFPDKAAAARELARVLRPGARAAIADVTASRPRLPAELLGLEAWVACFGDARPLAELGSLLVAAGLELERVEAHDRELEELVDRVEARLRLAELATGQTFSAAEPLVSAARRALQDGVLGYAVLIARRP
jgi:SAM-dependent methyltransferase